MMAPSVVAKNFMTMLDLGQPRVVLGEGLKYIHGYQYQGDLFGCVCSHTIAHR
jgi:hypothetical protein